MDGTRNVYSSVHGDHEQEKDLLLIRGKTVRQKRPCLFRIATCGVGALLLAIAAWTAGRHWPLTASLRGSTEMTEKKTGQEKTKHLQFCGKVENDFEFHTMQENLAVFSDIASQDLCCAMCNGNPDCGAWTWGKRQWVDDLTHHCFLKKLAEGEEPIKVKRFGVVSGLPYEKLRKHGMVAEVLGSREQAEVAVPVPWNVTCAGSVNVTGHGMLSVVNAHYSAPDRNSGGLAEAPAGWQVRPALGGRAYLAEGCSEKKGYEQGRYTSLKLLGKTLRYSIDLSGTGCGCDARVSLVPMNHGPIKSKCEDFYCSAREDDDCASSCDEISIQDANQYAWSSSLHLQKDTQGVSIGYGGGDRAEGRRDWTDAQYGPGAECIDTTWPFHVEARFPVDNSGNLQAMEITLTQDGRACPLHARIDRYGANGEGLVALGNVLKKGVTPVIQYNALGDLAWLDGLGNDGLGPCVQDSPEACPASVRLYDISVEDSAMTVKSKPTESGDSLLSAALSTIHESVETRAAQLRAEELENATELKEAGLLDGDCGEDCSSAGVEVSVEGSLGMGDLKKGTPSYEESISDQTEWEVVRQLEIRSTHSKESKLLDKLVPGEIVIGHQVGSWIDIAHRPGYAPISQDGVTRLQQRKTAYKKIVVGSCADTGLQPILAEPACKAAAFALGYFDTMVTMYRGKDKRPEGCYILNGQAFLATHPSNKGNGAAGGRMPICSSAVYPTTITVTTTTTTSTETSTTTTTSTTSTTWGFPSLFCFEVFMSTTYEFGLVKEQIRRGAGIFNCDEYAVFCQGGRINMGKPPHGKTVYSIWFQKAFVGKSQDGTAGNTLLFMHLWEAIKKDGRWADHDWTVKADPDAVVLPWRIRTHLRQATGQPNYLVNCNKYPGNPNFPMIYGAFEAYSVKSLTTYFGGGDHKCKTELNWQPWGEDFFMHHCMKHLGVQEYDDFGILSDKRCMGANCRDGWAAAYHDFKTQGEWFQCWDEATAPR